jgi:pimeloyl-ACP methyl ester carboxylesterase
MTPPDTCAGWLDEVLAQLGSQPAHLVGTSFGGWVAMNQALRAPGRVASVTLLDPAGLTPLDARFWWWLSVSGAASLTPRPVRRRLARWLDNPAMLDQEMMNLMWAGIRSYRMERKFPALLTDGQLAAITVPALLVTGARSALITPAQARDRASHLPNAQVAIVPGSHGGFNRLDALNARVAAFLQSVGAAA